MAQKLACDITGGTKDVAPVNLVFTDDKGAVLPGCRTKLDLGPRGIEKIKRLIAYRAGKAHKVNTDNGKGRYEANPGVWT